MILFPRTHTRTCMCIPDCDALWGQLVCSFFLGGMDLCQCVSGCLDVYKWLDGFSLLLLLLLLLLLWP